MSVNRAKRSIVGGVGFGLSNGVLFLTYALLFWFGSVLIKRGDVNFRELMTAILTLMLGALGLGQALADMGDQKKGLQIAGKIFKSIEEGEEAAIDGLSRSGKVYTVDTPDAGKYGKALGRIELKDVFFRYPTRPDVEVTIYQIF